MSDREKLIELWETAEKRFVDFCRGRDNCKSCPYNKYGFKCSRAYIIDNLMSNGVTMQKWIPVSERLPKFGQQVLVSCAGYELDYVTAMNFWSEKSCDWVSVTHWMPLPEPPKECE